MRRVLATLVALSLVMSMFTGVFAPVPEARAAGPAPVVLGTAGDFAILAKTGISTSGVTHVTGDIGVSPMDQTGLTGFSETLDSTGTFSTSIYVAAPFKLYAADYTDPTPTKMTTAVSDMETAYTDAAGRTPGVGPFLNIGSGTVAGQTLAPGLYTWGSNVTITTDLTLSGTADDVWILQIAGTLDIAPGKQVLLSGGALAKNIFWQVADAVTFYPYSHFEGNILAQTNVAMQTGATLNGRALAQSAVTLDASTVVAPANINTVMYTLTPSAGVGGTISPSIVQDVLDGNSTTFTITPNTGYQIADVLVDSSSVGAVSTYTFSNVVANHTITATFTSSTTIRGDINGDGIVTMADALLVARYVAGLTTLTASQLLAADLNHDGFVNMIDVLVIAQIVVGISS